MVLSNSRFRASAPTPRLRSSVAEKVSDRSRLKPNSSAVSNELTLLTAISSWSRTLSSPVSRNDVKLVSAAAASPPALKIILVSSVLILLTNRASNASIRSTLPSPVTVLKSVSIALSKVSVPSPSPMVPLPSRSTSIDSKSRMVGAKVLTLIPSTSVRETSGSGVSSNFSLVMMMSRVSLISLRPADIASAKPAVNRSADSRKRFSSASNRIL